MLAAAAGQAVVESCCSRSIADSEAMPRDVRAHPPCPPFLRGGVRSGFGDVDSTRAPSPPAPLPRRGEGRIGSLARLKESGQLSLQWRAANSHGRFPSR